MTATAHRRAGISLIAILATACVLAVTGAPASASGSATAAARRTAAQSWLVAGQNIANTRDQAAETLISPGNVSQLAPAWSITTAGDVTATPTMVNNVLYFPDMGGMLWAVTSTGHVVWSNPVASYTGITGDVSRDSPARRTASGR